MSKIKLYDNNHTGLIADITFSALTGGSTYLGAHTIPYTFAIDYPYGTYSLFYSQWAQTCSVTITEPEPFISTWRTTSPNETIYLPIYNGGIYNFIVDWGDGNIETITSYLNNSHEYAVAGDYTVTISGTIEGWSFYYYNTSRLNIIEILQWGQLKLGNLLAYYFYSCENLILTGVTDVPNLSNTTNLSYMFRSCSSLTFVTNINNWDVSNVQNMSGMFMQATLFNSDISNWDVSNVNTMEGMFVNTQFNQPLSGWNVSNVQNMAVMFGSTPFNQPLNNWERTNSPDTSTLSGVTNMTAMFGQTTLFNSDISNWNVSNVQNMSSMFQTSPFNGDISNWNVSNVTNMQQMFMQSFVFNQDLSGWDVSNVNNMIRMFNNAIQFNQDLSSWCVANILSLPANFDTGASSWVLPRPVWGTCPFISTWRTTSPNETIGLPLTPDGNYNFTVNWGDGNIETITSYLNNSHEYAVAGDYRVTISGTIDGWSFYVNIYNLYYGTPTKIINVLQWGNLKLGTRGGGFFGTNNLTLSGVTDILNLQDSYNLSYLFKDSSIQNVNRINEWNVSDVNTMEGMFWNAHQFNSNISTWNTKGVTNMELMFSAAYDFNSDISNWNVSNVQEMTGMFDVASNFNADISNWNVANVIFMGSMFFNAFQFNQDLSSWCVANILSLPVDFDTGASSWVLPRPVWGTCPFISTWRTTSPNETIGLPLTPDGNYNFTVNWGDGNIETITSYLNNSHEYAVAGDYRVTISGTIDGWSFYVNIYNLYYGTPTKIINVLQWGNLKLGTRGGGFFGTNNLTLSGVTDILNLQDSYNLSYLFKDSSIQNVNRINEWNVSDVNTMEGMFWNAHQFNSNISTWNTKGVTNMELMFSAAYDFNSDISNWNVSNVQEMTGMFDVASNFNADISNWNVANVIFMGSMFFNAFQFNQDLSSWCVANILSLPVDFDTGALSWTLPRPVWGTCPFVSTWRTITPNETIGLPLTPVGNYNFTVNWGDGNIETITDYTNNTHTYLTPGDYKVTISGTIDGWSFFDENVPEYYGTPTKIINVLQWGNLKLGNLQYNFAFTTNLTLDSVSDILNLQGVTTLGAMFLNSSISSVNRINEWDVSNVNNLGSMFGNATSFNQPLTGWNVSNVTTMGNMFQGATSFNGDISNWDVSSVDYMGLMFFSATSFNGDISNWNVSNVQNMSSMFRTSPFNGDISNWNVSNVIVMRNMFENATLFNQDLSPWCVSNIPSLPTDFDNQAFSWVLPRPIWGTCPLIITFNPDGTRDTTWIVSSGSKGDNFDMTVNWGDGQISAYTGSNNYQPVHTYLSGTFDAIITVSDESKIKTFNFRPSGLDNFVSSILRLSRFINLNTLNLAVNIIVDINDILPLPSLLTVLRMDANNMITFNPASPLPSSLQFLILYDNPMITFNPTLPLPSSLQSLSLNDNLLGEFNPALPLPSSLQYLDLQGNYLPTSEVNNVLINLSGTSVNGGELYLSVQTPPACPTGDGIIAQNHLVNDLGWTVTVDTGCPVTGVFRFSVNSVGGSFNGIGVYSDLSDFTATVNWGDGVTETITSTGNNYRFEHTYVGTQVFNGTISFNDVNLITEIDFGWPDGFNTNITSINISKFTQLIYLNTQYNLEFTELDISKNVNLLTLNCGANKLDTNQLNNILINLSNAGLSNGTVELGNQNPIACPSGDGILAQNHLVNDLGWTVTVDTGCP